MLIQPNSTIKILKGCPLNNTYEHTIYFKSPTKQAEYFTSLSKHILLRQSYQRYSKGVLTVNVRPDDLYDCNYLMFRNDNFGTKWFYAFITDIEYVNNVTSRVSYEIDVMQTWYFEYTLKESFVEREHSLTDNIGDNTVPEKLERGEFVYTKVTYGDGSVQQTPFDSSTLHMMVLATFDDNFDDVGGGINGYVYSGLYVHKFDNSIELNKFIKTATTKNKQEGIVGIYMIPEQFRIESGINGPLSDQRGEYVGFRERIIPNLSTIDGYTPKNNKLFTMPYNSLFVSNNVGNSATYGWEYFTLSDIGTADLWVQWSAVNSPEYAITPARYKGLENNHLERCVLPSTPPCSYNSSAFSQWLAQNKANITAQAIGDIGGLLAGIMGVSAGLSTLNPALTTIGVHTLSSSFINTTRLFAEGIDKSTLPANSKGNTTDCGLFNMQHNLFGFSLFYCTIRKEYAKKIDDYFNRYGYATNELKIPNTSVREQWTFTKTCGCVAVGSVPANAMSLICKIYDNGITFWKDPNNVGDYSLDNYPIGEV